MKRFAFLLAALFCDAAGIAAATEASVIEMRNHNPFLGIYGLPVFRTAATPAAGEFAFTASVDIASHAEAGLSASETVTIDAESHTLNLALRYGLSSAIELGIDVPFVARSGGFLDSTIEAWHELWGFPNGNRDGPSDQVNLLYARNGSDTFAVQTAERGIGDVQLSAGWALRRSNGNDRRRLSLRAALKLPTGDADELRGSGGSDVSVALYGANEQTIKSRSLAYSAFVGVLALGDGDLFADVQRDVVPFAGVSVSYALAERFEVLAQLYAQGAYHDSTLDAFGGTTLQLTVGAAYRYSNSNTRLLFGLTEDPLKDAATDVAFHLAIQFGSRP